MLAVSSTLSLPAAAMVTGRFHTLNVKFKQGVQKTGRKTRGMADCKEAEASDAGVEPPDTEARWSELLSDKVNALSCLLS